MRASDAREGKEGEPEQCESPQSAKDEADKRSHHSRLYKPSRRGHKQKLESSLAFNVATA